MLKKKSKWEKLDSCYCLTAIRRKYESGAREKGKILLFSKTLKSLPGTMSVCHSPVYLTRICNSEHYIGLKNSTSEQILSWLQKYWLTTIYRNTSMIRINLADILTQLSMVTFGRILKENWTYSDDCTR